MSYAQIELALKFEDESTGKLTFGPYATNSAAISGLKQRIKGFNAGTSITGGWYGDIVNADESKLVQPGGTYPNVPIVEATIVTTNETRVL